MLDKVGTEREMFKEWLSRERGGADWRGTERALEGVEAKGTPPTF